MGRIKGIKRAIIKDQPIETRLDQICTELTLTDVRKNLLTVAQIILDLELQLRDCEADLARLESQPH